MMSILSFRSILRRGARRAAFFGVVGAGLAGLSTPLSAGENCQCRAGGTYYNEGAVVCLGTGGNSQLARCEMALNNTSWKMLGEACPQASLQPSDTDDTAPNMTLRQDKTVIR